MVGVKIITVGTLKEAYLRDAAAEYEKRLSAFCKLSQTNLKEEKLPDSPSASEINNALSKEAERILAEMPRRAYKIALCVEGRQLSSEELAEKLGDVSATHGEVCIVIGSSHGLDESVKSACDLRLSFSRLTFPHQLMRVILLEAIYRGFNILKGTHYISNCVPLILKAANESVFIGRGSSVPINTPTNQKSIIQRDI